MANRAPVLSPFSADPIREGDELGISADFTDADVYDDHTATIDWGDGSPPEPAAVLASDGSGVVVARHVYAQDGAYTVTLTLADASGATATRTAAVAVANVAPRADAGGFVYRGTLCDGRRVDRGRVAASRRRNRGERR